MDNPTSHQQMEDPALTQSSSLLHYSFCFRPRDRIFFTFFWPSSGAMSMHWSLKYASADWGVKPQKAHTIILFQLWSLDPCLEGLRRLFPGAEGEITELVFKMGACHYRHSQPSPHQPFYVSHLSHPESTVPLWNPMQRLFFLVIDKLSLIFCFHEGFLLKTSLQAHYSKLWCLQLIFNYSFYAWRNGNTS